MMTIKIICVCGQKYAFDVEPMNRRMPSPVACPVCGVEGTARANEIIAQQLPPAPPPLPAAAPRMSMPIARPAAAPAVPAPAATATHAAPAAIPAAARVAAALPGAARDEAGAEGKGDTWKWWYYILVGILIGGYSIWQAYDQHRIKPLGELFLSFFLILVGIWSFQHKRQKKQAQLARH